MQVIYAVLVISSPVFQVNTDNDTPTVVKVPWTSVTRDLKTSTIQGTFLVHVVSVQHLAEFLEHNQLFLRHVGELVANRPTLLSRSSTVET
jgi:hypothetical protein